jgi:hypothetical protein
MFPSERFFSQPPVGVRIHLCQYCQDPIDKSGQIYRVRSYVTKESAQYCGKYCAKRQGVPIDYVCCNSIPYYFHKACLWALGFCLRGDGYKEKADCLPEDLVEFPVASFEHQRMLLDCVDLSRSYDLGTNYAPDGLRIYLEGPVFAH